MSIGYTTKRGGDASLVFNTYEEDRIIEWLLVDRPHSENEIFLHDKIYACLPIGELIFGRDVDEWVIIFLQRSGLVLRMAMSLSMSRQFTVN